MGGKASSDELGVNAVHWWIIQSSTAVLKYSVVPRHDISDGVVMRNTDHLGNPLQAFYHYKQALLLQTWSVVVREASGVARGVSKPVHCLA